MPIASFMPGGMTCDAAAGVAIPRCAGRVWIFNGYNGRTTSRYGLKITVEKPMCYKNHPIF